jgi:hypothetical protein
LRRTPGSGVVFTIARDQQLKDVVIKLFPQAVITGKVFDTNGAPVLGATVVATQLSYDDFGEKTFAAVTQSGRTDDTGAFRIFGLSAGEYYIRASEAPLSGGMAFYKYVIYYPSGRDALHAHTVSVKSGEELALPSIVVPIVDTAPVRFRIITDLPNLPDQIRTMQFSTPGSSDFINVTSNNRYSGVPNTIEHSGLPLGPNEIRVALYLPDSGVAFGQSAYQLTDSPEKPTVDVVLRKGVHFVARVMLEKPDGTLEPLGGVQLNITPSPNSMSQIGGQTAKDGTVSAASAPPSQYRLRVSGLPEDTYVIRLMQDGMRLTQPLFTISTDSQLEIVATNTGSDVDGVVRDSRSQIAPGSLVALIPAAQSQRGEYYLYRSASSDQNGKFTFRNVHPGIYKLFAWIEAPGPGAFRNAEFLSKYEDYGKQIEVATNAQATLDLRLADEVP